VFSVGAEGIIAAGPRLSIVGGPKNTLPRFAGGGLEAMRVLWRHGQLKRAEIQQRFQHGVTRIALCGPNLLSLLEMGHVTGCRRGRAYYYWAATPREWSV